MKNAFSMIELIFVIVVLGILSAIAIPKFSATRTDAVVAKTRSDVASIRAAIVTERQSRLIKGDKNYISKLHNANDTFFDTNGSSQLLMYGIKATNTNEHWQENPTTSGTITKYIFVLSDNNNTFEYDSSKGTFLCTSGDSCSILTE